MLEFRVTKYDPTCRDASGAYIRDEWTSFKDIGKPFPAGTLTEADYLRFEDAYAKAAMSFMRDADIEALTVEGLENAAAVALTIADGSRLDLEEAETMVRRVLREEFWCRLVAPDAFVHIGWDYNMYIGVGRPCPIAQALARKLGLFVESYRSPYIEHRQV